MHPEPSPQEIMEHEADVALKTAAIQGAADTTKHRTSEGAKVEMERHRSEAKKYTADTDAKKTTDLATRVAEVVAGATARGPRKLKFTRGADGKLTGAEEGE
jgi:hypothetical protein